MVWPYGLLDQRTAALPRHSRGNITGHNHSCIAGEANDQNFSMLAWQWGKDYGRRVYCWARKASASARRRRDAEYRNLPPGSRGLTRRGGPAQRALPPVEQWNPPFCGDIDMRIARDGTWFYCGTPIGRPALVRLFSTILRKDPEGYVLVTPVERVGIKVEDAPFLAVEMTVAQQGADQVLRFLTNVGDWVEAGFNHPIRFERAALRRHQTLCPCARRSVGACSAALCFSISWNLAK